MRFHVCHTGLWQGEQEASIEVPCTDSATSYGFRFPPACLHSSPLALGCGKLPSRTASTGRICPLASSWVLPMGSTNRKREEGEEGALGHSSPGLSNGPCLAALLRGHSAHPGSVRAPPLPQKAYGGRGFVLSAVGCSTSPPCSPLPL